MDEVVEEADRALLHSLGCTVNPFINWGFCEWNSMHCRFSTSLI